MSRVSKGLAAWIATLLLVLAALTLLRLAETPLVAGGAGQGDPATVVIKECERVGPVSLGGIGYFHECTATVSVGGHAEVVEFGPDELSPSDGFSPIGVTDASGEWRRNVTHPFGFLEMLGIVFLLSSVLAGFSGGWRVAIGWLTFGNRRQSTAKVDRLEPDAIELLTPDNAKFLARYFFSAVSGGLSRDRCFRRC